MVFGNGYLRSTVYKRIFLSEDRTILLKIWSFYDDVKNLS